MQSSPLGQYAAPVAAVAAIAVILAYLIVAGSQGGDSPAAKALEFPFAVALGAVFGSSVAVNGYRRPVEAMGLKLDAMQSKLAAVAAVPPSHPDAASLIVEAVSHGGGGVLPPPPASPTPGG